MSAPQRFQIRRTKGWRKPEGGILCSRPGPYGNPFPWKGSWITWTAVAIGFRADEQGRKAAAVALHRAWITDGSIEVAPATGGPGSIEYADGSTATFEQAARGFALWASQSEEAPPLPARPDLDPLRGHDLGCWCRLSDPCHVDTLLELANR